MRYALQIITAWIASGEIFSRCREKRLAGTQLSPELVERAALEADDLASDVVSDALLSFRDQVLKTHRWHAERGATLKTFFIGQCLIKFVPIIRTWRQAILRQIPVEVVIDERAQDAEPGPATTTVERDSVRRLLEDVIDPTLRSILFLISQSFTHPEIAEILGLGSTKAVEARVYRHRVQHKQVQAHA